MDPEDLLVTVSEASGHGWHVHCAGELDAATSERLLVEIEALAGRDAKLVVLDLTGVEFVDSSGLRAIVAGGQAMEAVDGRLVIEGMSAAAQQLLELTGLIEKYRHPDA